MRLECDCGFVAQGKSDDELVRSAQLHAGSAHRMHLTAQQILAVAYEHGALGSPPQRGVTNRT